MNLKQNNQKQFTVTLKDAWEGEGGLHSQSVYKFHKSGILLRKETLRTLIGDKWK